ncbi:MAG: response regulator, partial [Chloroflexi bacterium]|nr:response regulator [Chloroflexota bacterium]
MRILLADDEAVIRLGLRAMLEDAGHQVVGTAPNGRVAVELAQSTQPDAVILDIKMPVLDGLTAARQIMAHRPTAIVILTAFNQPDFVEQANDASVFAYLVKPIKEERLTPTLEIAVSRFAEWQEIRAQVQSLQESLEARDLIEQAKRVLMQSDGLTERQAFLKIHHQSR